MGKNYYALLGVHQSATDMDIAQRFRILAITYHPAKHVSTMAKSNYIFSEICEAYDVLSDCKFKNIFDIIYTETLRKIYD
jgi:DnaJ-class molecular chaperone